MAQRQFITAGFFTLVCGLSFTACSSSPMKARLEKNFVFNCSLELINKNVSPTDAERICTSSHQAEMQENQSHVQETAQAPVAPKSKAAQETAPAVPMVKEESPTARVPASVPVDTTAPVATPEATPAPAGN